MPASSTFADQLMMRLGITAAVAASVLGQHWQLGRDSMLVQAGTEPKTWTVIDGPKNRPNAVNLSG